MGKLDALSSKPFIREYAQGAAQANTQPIADFLAPTVEVATLIGNYKKYNDKSRFRIPDTRRGIGGEATVLNFTAEDATYRLQPHALDVPIDELEQLESEAFEDLIKESADAAAEVGGLSHEKKVVDKALEAAGAGTSKTWDANADPVNDIDGAILDVLKAAKYGSAMGVGILFGPNAWKICKNQKEVKSRYIVAAGGPNRSVGQAVPTVEDFGNLLIAKPEVRVTFMVYDNAPEGKSEDIKFLLDNVVLIFARKESPTRRDPSFMKTLKLRGKWMTPRFYTRADERVEFAGWDWIEEVVVANSTAVKRFNIS